MARKKHTITFRLDHEIKVIAENGEEALKLALARIPNSIKRRAKDGLKIVYASEQSVIDAAKAAGLKVVE